MKKTKMGFGIQMGIMIAAGLIVLPALAALQTQTREASPWRIVRVSSAFDALVPKDAQFEKVAGGFEWVEGPVWNKKEGYLLFSDIPNNSIFQWKGGSGIKLFLKPSGYMGTAPFEGREPGSNGLTFDPSGHLVMCEHGDRRISRLEADGSKTTLVDRYQGKRLNSPNDVVFKSNGDMYFTDPPFGLPKSFDDPAKELPFQGVYRVSKTGEVTLLTNKVKAPNGIAFSPDEKTLYVSNADRTNAVWMAFPVNADGTLGEGRVIFNATEWAKTKKGVPDGMKVDGKGNLFGAGPGGLHIISPEGKHLGSFEIDVPTSNCAWGNDGSMLYITANTEIYRIRLNTKGPGY